MFTTITIKDDMHEVTRSSSASTRNLIKLFTIGGFALFAFAIAGMVFADIAWGYLAYGVIFILAGTIMTFVVRTINRNRALHDYAVLVYNRGVGASFAHNYDANVTGATLIGADIRGTNLAREANTSTR